MLALLITPDYGTRQSRPLSIRDPVNAIAFADMLMLATGSVTYLTVPTWPLSFVVSLLKDFFISHCMEVYISFKCQN